jgi:hypothetical protein
MTRRCRDRTLAPRSVHKTLAVAPRAIRASTSGCTGPSEGEEMAVGTAELSVKRYFTKDQARAIATELGIDFGALGCDLEQFRMGLGVELEHGPRDPETDVSGSDAIVTGKIALAHLAEFPDYYTRLATLEREATAEKQKK